MKVIVCKRQNEGGNRHFKMGESMLTTSALIADELNTGQISLAASVAVCFIVLMLLLEISYPVFFF